MTKIITYEERYFGALVELLHEWGMEIDIAPESVREQLRRIAQHAEHKVYLAIGEDDRLAGYALAEMRHMLGHASFVEVVQLLVAENARSNGVGATLLKQIEKEYAAKGATHMRLHSNSKRERAHSFYQREGFTHYKTSKFFEKEIG